MPILSLLIKPAGALCNMRCRYCFYRDEEAHRTQQSSQIMSAETLEAVYAQTLPCSFPRCSVTFQGGEPTLAGLDFFRQAMELEQKYVRASCQIDHALQTNGLNIDAEWAEFLASEHFLVGVSLDGPKALHDENRVDTAGKGTYARVLNAIRLLEAHKVNVSILSVVTHSTARSSRALYGFFARCGFEWQQYIPCLDPLGEPFGSQVWSLTPEDYGEFLKSQFDCWYRDFKGGHPRYNRYFDNLVGILLGRQPEACDMRGVCSPQLVVEADGSVYPCDFYALDAFRLGNFRTDTLEAIEKRRKELAFIENSAVHDTECAECRWKAFCRGGCRRHRTSGILPDDTLGRSRFCKSFLVFFPYAYPRLCEVARVVLQRR